MTTRPWMPLNVADYLRDTSHLRALESGAYLHLIMAYWVSASLPNDDRQLATIAKLSDKEWRAIKPTIAAFFGEGFSSHKRIDKEIAKAAEISNKRRSAVEQREIKRRSNDPSNDDTLNTLQNKEDNAPDGAQSRYAFENGCIRLKASDLEKWRKAYVNLDLEAELLGLTQWAGTQGNNWFCAVSGALAKRNRDIGIRKTAAQRNVPVTPNGNLWPEGIT